MITQRRPRVRLRRVAVLLVCIATIGPGVSGCAAVLRVLSVAEAASTVGGILGATPGSTVDRAPAGPRVRAVVTGTRGSGLRLESRPGTGRLAALPDGTPVTVTCSATGPRVDGPRGPTSTWSQVEIPGHPSGYMSNAFLTFDADVATPPPC